MDIKSWGEKHAEATGSLLEKTVQKSADVLEQLMPRIRAKALDNGQLEADCVLTYRFNFPEEGPASVEVEGLVPPKIVKCQQY